MIVSRATARTMWGDDDPIGGRSAAWPTARISPSSASSATSAARRSTASLPRSTTRAAPHVAADGYRRPHADGSAAIMAAVRQTVQRDGPGAAALEHPADDRVGLDERGAAAAQCDAARRVRRAWRCWSPRSAPTACSRIRSRSGQRSWACAWRLAPIARRLRLIVREGMTVGARRHRRRRAGRGRVGRRAVGPGLRRVGVGSVDLRRGVGRPGRRGAGGVRRARDSRVARRSDGRAATRLSAAACNPVSCGTCEPCVIVAVRGPSPTPPCGICVRFPHGV